MRKDEIINKSLKLFASKGYLGTSMNDIAVASGIKKASLYSHYPSKESIFTAVFDFILDDYTKFIVSITTCTEDTNYIEKLTSIFSSYVRNCIDNKNMIFWDRYYYYPPEFIKDYISIKTNEIEMLFMDKIITIIQDGIEHGEIKDRPAPDIALSFYYMMIGFAMSIGFYTKKEVDVDITKCITVFIDGIKP